MKISSIVSFNQQLAQKQSPNFKGVFGEQKFIKSFEEGNDYFVKQFDMDYYPFADEDIAETEKLLKNKTEELKKAVARNYRSDAIIDIEETSLNVQKPLHIGKNDLYQLGEGKMTETVKKIYRFLNAHAKEFAAWK